VVRRSEREGNPYTEHSVSGLDSAERLLLTLLLATFVAYTTSYILRDYWSALGSAVLAR
jgi:hypothetical protein